MCLSKLLDVSKINHNENTVALTHDKDIHADDVFAGALLKIAFDGKVTIKRTRDINALNEADIVFDMGLTYDGFRCFDHHQEEEKVYTGEFGDSIKHCAFTLLAKSLFREERYYEKFMELVGYGIAIRDNGQKKYLNQYSSLGKWVKFFNSTYYEECDHDMNYKLAVNFAQAILTRVIKHIDAWFRTENSLKTKTSKADKLLVLDEYLPFEEYVCENCPNILMAIYPSLNRNEWFLSALPSKKGDNRFHRIYMPSGWRGFSSSIQDGSLIKDLKDCNFVSFRGSHSAWKTKDAAINAANKIISSYVG